MSVRTPLFLTVVSSMAFKDTIAIMLIAIKIILKNIGFLPVSEYISIFIINNNVYMSIVKFLCQLKPTKELSMETHNDLRGLFCNCHRQSDQYEVTTEILQEERIRQDAYTKYIHTVLIALC